MNRKNFMSDLNRIIEENQDELSFLSGKGDLDDIDQETFNEISEMVKLDKKIKNILSSLSNEKWESLSGFTLRGNSYGMKRDAIVSHFRSQLRQ